MSKLFRHKTIRDPLYGFVEISERETQVIDTDVFRRLQYIKQLSHAYVVYPSAVHTRFEHSLGTTHIAGRLCSELELDHKKTSIVRLSALLHDVGKPKTKGIENGKVHFATGIHHMTQAFAFLGDHLVGNRNG